MKKMRFIIQIHCSPCVRGKNEEDYGKICSETFFTVNSDSVCHYFFIFWYDAAGRRMMQFCRKMENTGMVLSQEAIDPRARAELGLDKPFLTQYFVWLGNLLQGDMGTSYISGKGGFSHPSFQNCRQRYCLPGFPFCLLL